MSAFFPVISSLNPAVPSVAAPKARPASVLATSAAKWDARLSHDPIHDNAYYGKCMIGGILSCGLTHTGITPLDVVKCNMQVNPAKYGGLLPGIKTIAAEEGAGALFKGWAPTAIGYSAQGMCKFGFYEFFKDTYSTMAGEENAYKYRGAIYLAGSASAEFFADMALCPMEMVKVKVQTSPAGTFPPRCPRCKETARRVAHTAARRETSLGGIHSTGAKQPSVGRQPPHSRDPSAMADLHAALPVCDLRPDDDEPEEEDPRRNSLASGESSALIVKPPPLQLAVAAETSMQNPANAELVYPWVASDPGAVSIITESSMMTPTTLYATAVRSEPGPRREGVTTALLANSPHTLKNNRSCSTEKPLGYGTNVSMQRRHSILRMSASKTSSGHGLRKSASVEFVLDHAHQQAAQSIHASTSSIGREPRRLTFEEKAELYRVRPDLEIGPAPYYNEKLEELNRRNQRRIIFAMFGGMISIVLLLVFFSMWEQNK